jgi:hypothetical protein
LELGADTKGAWRMSSALLAAPPKLRLTVAELRRTALLLHDALQSPPPVEIDYSFRESALLLSELSQDEVSSLDEQLEDSLPKYVGLIALRELETKETLARVVIDGTSTFRSLICRAVVTGSRCPPTLRDQLRNLTRATPRRRL